MCTKQDGLIEKLTKLNADAQNINSAIEFNALGFRQTKLEDEHYFLYKDIPKLENDEEIAGLFKQLNDVFETYAKNQGKSQSTLHKQGFVEELTAVKSFADNMKTKEELLTIDDKINDLDDRYDFAFWSGRGGIGDDEDIFPLIDEITFSALKFAEANRFEVSIAGCETVAEYQSVLDGTDKHSLRMKERFAKEEARRELIKTKIEINPVYADHLNHVMSGFLFKYEGVNVEALSKCELRQKTMEICKNEVAYYISELTEHAMDMNKCDYVSQVIDNIIHFRAVYRTLNAGH